MDLTGQQRLPPEVDESEFLSTSPQPGETVPAYGRPVLYLSASGLEGVGVFAGAPILSGTKLPLFARSEKVRKRKISTVPFAYRRYLVPDCEVYAWAPTSFNRMSIGWYLNHGAHPNVSHQWIALRDIAEGEELTIDYDGL